MPNLVGIGLSQVPTNSMLGGLAYQDPEHASIKNLDLKNLSQINSEIADTARDVFVYDTSKDSDGGAWRKRTQSTSWYNETLNTATRGSRKEFPAVAVIVAENDKVTIYDGDDPDLPMWMVLNTDSSDPTKYAIVRSVNQNISSLYALNGIICDPVSFNGLFYQNFVEDACYRVNVNNTVFGGNIVNRNGGMNFALNITSSGLVSSTVNDVAMTVLPNAPIDSATGLPIPTIAVATYGGTSVIRDDGTVADLTGFAPVDTIHIDESNVIGSVNTTSTDFLYKSHVPLSDETFSNGIIAGSKYYYLRSGSETIPFLRDINVACTAYDSKDDVVYRGGNAGFDIIRAGVNYSTTHSNPSIAYISKDYNTGYMVGDIKGAFLSDTTAESFSPSNLVSEDFSVNWTGTTNGVLSVSSGQLTITNSGGSNGRAQSNTFATTGGKNYAFIVKAVSNSSATYRLEVRGPELVTTGTTDGQTLVVYFNGTGNSSTFVELYAIGSSGASATYEDAYVVEIEEDRSVNNKGLQVFGTITKSAVATGADLVGYSGYSASNYLVQPNITAPGTGDFSVTFWVKPGSLNTGTGNYLHVFSLGTSATGGQGRSTGFTIKLTTNTTDNANGYSPYFYSATGSNNHGTYNASNFMPLGKWSQLVAMRRGGVAYLYHDGKLMQTGNSWTTNLTDTYLTVFRGISYNEYGGDAKFALLRYSSSAPSPEQIKKIYEDEKCLFHENAKATLYGSSDAVTALAFDDTTNLLHVGTSAGRSEFQGLSRINNTTDAVTTAISASNGLVAEQ